MDILNEATKEVLFGGLAGFAAGYISRKAGNQVLGLALGGGFVAFRAAVYDGEYLATWSPLAKDDSSFGQHMKRKAKKEAYTLSRRVEDFTQENVLILGGFTGFYLLGQSAGL
jgi:hypothetical protein